MRKPLVLLLAYAFILIPAPANAARRAYARHAREFVGKRAVGGAAAHAALGQARHSPREWGGGVGGYSKRFLSGLGQHAAKVGIQSGVAGLHHEDLHYHRSNLHG